jgi:hypothetical protein
MKTNYKKNYTEKGYLMHYVKQSGLYYPKNQVLQFKIELHEIEPLIWRRIQVPSDYNFWDLHVAIQDSMGWEDRHLHHFEIKGKGKRDAVQIGIPDLEGWDDDMPEVFPGWEIMVKVYFNDLGVEAEYHYDYGDSWVHKVKLEGIMYREKSIKYPVCIGGERACPPEDCGGVGGYYNVIKTLSDLKNDDYKGMRIWAGRNWNAAKFDKNKVKFDDPYKRWKYAFLEK